jgi:hypothetical protein
MKYFATITTIFLSLLLVNVYSYSQQILTPEEYDLLKSSGQLEQLENVIIDHSFSPPKLESTNLNRSVSSSVSCEGYTHPDSSYTFIPPSDDGSEMVVLPFQFCFYGTLVDTIYINNNGNISFSNPHPTFSGVGFPSDQFEMIAPFWGDVDTRDTGAVSYKVTNTAIIINWEDVGYFNQQTNKVNSFQLTLTDGVDPLLPSGSNVSFCYKDMQWTTGSASGGVNGFGGTPATVGANKGDNINFVQFGRFNAPGSSYDGPFNNSDGVSWLDDQSMYFNVCGNQNIPPVLVGQLPCDTVYMFIGDTFDFDFSFLAPEQGQSTVVQVISVPSNGNVSIQSNGVQSDIQGTFSPDFSNVGLSLFELEAFDNASNPDTVSTVIPVMVYPLDMSQIIVGNTSKCENETTPLSTVQLFDTYSWSTGSTNPSIDVAVAGTYFVTVTIGNYIGEDTIVVSDVPVPTIDIVGDTNLCELDTAVLSVSGIYPSIVWSTGEITPQIEVVSATGVSVTVLNAEGCEASDSVTVSFNMLPTLAFEETIEICSDSTLILDAQNSGASYLWSTGETTQQIELGFLAPNTQNEIWTQVTDTNGCVTSDTTIIESIDCSVGITSLSGNELVVFPNPAENILNFSSPISGEIVVQDVSGKVVFVKSLLNTRELDVSQLKPGTYFIKLMQEDKVLRWNKK